MDSRLFVTSGCIVTYEGRLGIQSDPSQLGRQDLNHQVGSWLRQEMVSKQTENHADRLNYHSWGLVPQYADQHDCPDLIARK